MRKYRVNVISDEQEITTHELELKQPQDKQVLIRVDACAICTLEQRVYKGVMKRYPFAGGHEVSGTIESIGENVKNVEVGDKVAVFLLTSCGECYYCRKGLENQCVQSFKTSIHEGFVGPGGLSEYMLVDAKRVYRLADDINMSHAALTEPLACCVHSINNANVELGNDVVVIGVGIMGGFHIQLAKLRGARVIACDINEERLDVAKKLGADIVINSNEKDAIEEVKTLTEGRGADVVFCTAAISQLAADSIEMVGKLGRVVMYSSFHPDNPIDLNVNKVHSKEITITGAVNPCTSDFLTSTRLLSNNLINVSDLISDEININEIGKAFERAVDPSTYRIIVKCNK